MILQLRERIILSPASPRKMLKLIQPISKKDQVVSAIKDAILSGDIEPGEQIVESRMAHQLGSGIPLVREALIALEHESAAEARKIMKQSLRGWKDDMMAMHSKEKQ